METLPIHFAPLQGCTEAAYRNAHAASFGGVDTYYAPFVRIERGEFRRKDIRDIEPDSNTVPHLIPQLIAPNVEKAARIIDLFIEKGHREIDFNLGCPFPVLAKRHNGSGILPYPEEVKALLSIVEKHPDIRFSVKMRLGWEHPEECLALAPLLNDFPLAHISLHARLGKQEYKGEVDLDGFSAFYEACKHPLIYNGDLHTVTEIEAITTRFPKLAGIMIGRGLLENPALAVEYKEGRTLSADEWRKHLQALHSAVFAHYEEQIQGGEGQLLTKMKSFWDYLLPDADRKLKKAIHKANKLTAYQQAAIQLIAFTTNR